MQVFVWTYVPTSRGIAGHMVTLCLTSGGTAKLFPKAAAPFQQEIFRVSSLSLRRAGSQGPYLQAASAGPQKPSSWCPSRWNPRAKPSPGSSVGNVVLASRRAPPPQRLRREENRRLAEACGHCSFLPSQPRTDCGKGNYNPQSTAVLRQPKGPFRVQLSRAPSCPGRSPGRP